MSSSVRAVRFAFRNPRSREACADLAGPEASGEHTSDWCGPWFQFTRKICTPSLLENCGAFGSAHEESSIILDRAPPAQTRANAALGSCFRARRSLPDRAGITPPPPVPNRARGRGESLARAVLRGDSQTSLTETNGGRPAWESFSGFGAPCLDAAPANMTSSKRGFGVMAQVPGAIYEVSATLLDGQPLPLRYFNG